MNFNLVTLFPDFFTPFFAHGVTGKAFQKGLASHALFNPRKHTKDVHQTVDDRPFGGADGMLMLAQPLADTVAEIDGLNGKGMVVYLSPQGQVWNQTMAKDWAQNQKNVTLICGRYGGVDQRFINSHVDIEISVGDYVLSGGEFAAQIVIDSLVRLLPGVLGNEVSSTEDSFTNNLLEGPMFTRPAEWQGQVVPEYLRGGNHSLLQQMKEDLSLLLTFKKRPELFTLPQELLISAAKRVLDRPPEELKILGLEMEWLTWIKNLKKNF